MAESDERARGVEGRRAVEHDAAGPRASDRDDRRPRTSPWPPFVALGLAISEVGVLFGSFALTVGGVVLFGGSCAGAIGESGVATSTSRNLVRIGAAVAALGLAVWLVAAPVPTADLAAAPVPTADLAAAIARAPSTDGVAFRGAGIALGGALLVAAGYVRERATGGGSLP